MAGVRVWLAAMSFVHCLAAGAAPAPSDFVFLLHGDRLVARVTAEAGVQLPDCAAAGELARATAPLHVGRLDGRACWLVAVAAEAPAPAGWEWTETRALVGAFSPEQWHAVSCARELQAWGRRHRFCGTCGTATVAAENERALRCPQCGALHFPNPVPAVIVAVTRGDRLLLAHNRSFRAGMFSTLAGFVDPGETAEQAVVREVHEETGITVGALRYVASQPWPFPNSLMLGFRAVHVAGEIIVDGHEIVEAGWFTADALPDIPRVGTVARALIDGWLGERRR